MVNRELRNSTFEDKKHKPKFEFRTLLIMVVSAFSHTLQLMPNAFAGLPNLANLTLNMCRIKDIDATVFNISSLRYLDLSGNEFRDELYKNRSSG